MSKKKKKVDKAEKKAKVHKELEGFEIKINPLGEITSNYNIDQLNEFLDRNVHDKKLTDKGPGKMGNDDDFYVEETAEEEDSPEVFLKKGASAKGLKKKKSEDEDEEDDLEIDEEK